jgi:hypothetical protein
MAFERAGARNGFTLASFVFAAAVLAASLFGIYFIANIGEGGTPDPDPPPGAPTPGTPLGDLQPPEVTGVEIRPATVYAAPQARFALEARVKNDDGLTVAVDPDIGITIEWSSLANGVFEDPSVNPVIVNVPDDPGNTFQVEVRVTRTERQGGVETVTEFTDAADIAIAPNLEQGDNSDWVFAEHVDGNQPALALIQGVDGVGPVEDWAVGVVGSVRLGRNLMNSGGAKSEIAIFAQQRAMHLQPPDDPWTADPDQVDADPLPAAPPTGFREITVRVGLHEDTPASRNWASDQVKLAAGLLDRNRVGIALDYLEPPFLHSRRDPITQEPLPLGASPTAACDAVNNDLAGFDVFDPADVALYILLVPSFATGGRGWACDPTDDWESRVVYISLSEYTVTTLAHEIVHHLSQMAPHTIAHGHTTGVAGFDPSNLMWGFLSLEKANARDRLTAGQMYRMNVHPQSWLNLTLPLGMPITRACQSDVIKGICPALAADLGG